MDRIPYLHSSSQKYFRKAESHGELCDRIEKNVLAVDLVILIPLFFMADLVDYPVDSNIFNLSLDREQVASRTTNIIVCLTNEFMALESKIETLRRCEINKALLEEVDHLREENARLRKFPSH